MAIGTNKSLLASGTATSEGLLTLSANNQYLVLTGYGTTVGGTASLSGTAGATVPRIVGLVKYDGTINTTTALCNYAEGNNPRGATSTMAAIYGLTAVRVVYVTLQQVLPPPYK